MSNAAKGFTRLGFARTYLLPGLLVFLLPAFSIFFFRYAESRLDQQIRESVLRDIEKDEQLDAEGRQRATAFFTEHPFSELVRDKKFAEGLNGSMLFEYATFRWMIRMSVASIVSSIAVFVAAGICVVVSRRSQQAQYWSLTVGWQILRLFGALQTVIQGTLLVALSYWVTAILFQKYFLKLIAVAGIMAVVGALAVIRAIFKRPNTDFVVEGQVINRQGSPRLWRELGAICQRVGTAPPDQVVVGIDDNFFVTEVPVTVGGDRYEGRTLFVSLSLLKQMYGAEADAVLAHEMAHFSGNDTLYSKKISPLLMRYGAYLQALSDNPLLLPTFHFMHCFRALFELSLGAHSRDREYRADRIAAETTSSHDMSAALLRIAAYSSFRNRIQNDLFQHEEALDAANISSRIEQGFHAHACAFVADPAIGTIATAHPFDSHPPLSQRLESVGVPLAAEAVQTRVATPGDGRWFQLIDDAEQIERLQWSEFEERFRAFHEQALSYRYLPATDEERAIVAKYFPEITIEGKKGKLVLDCERIWFSAWPRTVPYGAITKCLNNNGTLELCYVTEESHYRKLPLKTFGNRQQEALQTFQLYYSRFMSAQAYQAQKQAGPVSV